MTTFSYLGGMDVTEPTLQAMARMIDVWSIQPQLVDLARSIVCDVPAHDAFGECIAIEAWVRDHIRYTTDPLGAEWVQDPAATLQCGHGDCDDMAVLAGSLLACVGHAAIPCAVTWIGQDRPTHAIVWDTSCDQACDPVAPVGPWPPAGFAVCAFRWPSFPHVGLPVLCDPVGLDWDRPDQDIWWGQEMGADYSDPFQEVNQESGETTNDDESYDDGGQVEGDKWGEVESDYSGENAWSDPGIWDGTDWESMGLTNADLEIDEGDKSGDVKQDILTMFEGVDTSSLPGPVQSAIKGALSAASAAVKGGGTGSGTGMSAGSSSKPATTSSGLTAAQLQSILAAQAKGQLTAAQVQALIQANQPAESTAMPSWLLPMAAGLGLALLIRR